MKKGQLFNENLLKQLEQFLELKNKFLIFAQIFSKQAL